MKPVRLDWRKVTGSLKVTPAPSMVMPAVPAVRAMRIEPKPSASVPRRSVAVMSRTLAPESAAPPTTTASFARSVWMG